MSNDEWITPHKYLDSIRRVFGGNIELDPASNRLAQGIVKADAYFTKEDDGLKYDWSVSHSIWLNPPYGQPAQALFIEKLISAHRANYGISSILLVNNTTDTEIIQKFMKTTAVAACFTRGRISFLNNNLVPVRRNERGQIFFYTGIAGDLFKDEFSNHGYCTYLDKQEDT